MAAPRPLPLACCLRRDHLHRVGAGASHLTSAAAHSAQVVRRASVESQDTRHQSAGRHQPAESAAIHASSACVARRRDASTACLEPIGRSIAPVARENVTSALGPTYLPTAHRRSASTATNQATTCGTAASRRFAAAPEPLYRDDCQDGTHTCFSCGWGNHARWESLPTWENVGMTNHRRWSQLPHPNHLHLRLRSMLLRRCRTVGPWVRFCF